MLGLLPPVQYMPLCVHVMRQVAASQQLQPSGRRFAVVACAAAAAAAACTRTAAAAAAAACQLPGNTTQSEPGSESRKSFLIGWCTAR